MPPAPPITLAPHLTFAGDCAEAFALYARVLGGMTTLLLTYGESPAGSDVPPEFRDKIVHGTLALDGMVLTGADVLPESYVRPQGFFLLLTVADRARAETIFAALAEGGDVKMALQATFWTKAFGVVVDRFGIPWEITLSAS